MVGFAEDRDKNSTVRESNAELVDIDGFDDDVVWEPVAGVVAVGEEVSKTVRIDVAWVGGNVNWEKWFQQKKLLLLLPPFKL